VGLLPIVLVSMAVGRPFTLQYAREQVEPEFWDKPELVRTLASSTTEDHSLTMNETR
jgi:hypothetical protein